MLQNDERQPREGLRARDQRRPHAEALLGGIWRPLPRHRATRLEHGKEGRLLTAHEPARPKRDLDLDPQVLADGVLRGGPRVDCLGMQVEVRPHRADRPCRDRDPGEHIPCVPREERAR